MRLRLENLGPVREAELDLVKPLIVLTGPNNAGKTYLAWAVYSLGRLGVVEPPTSVLAWVDRLFAAEDQTLPKESLWIAGDDVMTTLADLFLKQLPEDFAAPRERFVDTRVTLLRSDDGAFGQGSAGTSVKASNKLHASLVASEDTFQLRLSEKIEGSFEALPFESLDDETRSACRFAIGRSAIVYLKRAMLDAVREVLPVERLALNLFARELAAWRTELVDEFLLEARFGGEDPGTTLRQRAGLYPRVIRDALQIAIRNPQTVAPAPFADLADELERRVLGGTVSSTDDEIEFVPQGATGVALRLHQTASVVKSLVSLVLFLRYRAAPSERLIIDEPELNLHPDNQRRVARVLAKAVNRGLKIMMSTHSDYVVRELNNLIMLGQDTDEARGLTKELDYDADSTLQPEQLGVYLVNDGQCQPLSVTETGFEVETIDEEIHRLNRDSQTIYQRLFCD